MAPGHDSDNHPAINSIISARQSEALRSFVSRFRNAIIFTQLASCSNSIQTTIQEKDTNQSQERII